MAEWRLSGLLIIIGILCWLRDTSRGHLGGWNHEDGLERYTGFGFGGGLRKQPVELDLLVEELLEAFPSDDGNIVAFAANDGAIYLALGVSTGWTWRSRSGSSAPFLVSRVMGTRSGR